MNTAELILHNGVITTLDGTDARLSAVAISGGRISAIGGEELLVTARDGTKLIDLKGRRVIPGLNDSHIHVIRGGLNFNMELRWDGVPSLSLALRMLNEQALRTPPPQWVRVIGGWTEFQFAERRLPTLDEINAVSPDTPVFVLHTSTTGPLSTSNYSASIMNEGHFPSNSKRNASDAVSPCLRHVDR